MHARLQKVLAHAGVASRRAAEELVRAGRVSVNDQIVRAMGIQIDTARDTVAVDGRPVPPVVRAHYVVLHKPPGYVSTARDERGRQTVLDLVRSVSRLYPVGRLDADSEGLVLLTDDGDLAHRLTHPRFGVEKEYHVLVRGHPGRSVLDQLETGVDLREGRAAAHSAHVLRRQGPDTWLMLVLRQGWKRQIRRMCGMLGYPVERLVRVRIGPLQLGNLAPGRSRGLTAAEIASLTQLKKETHSA
jgi:23S rRNA pseudouridine2605 synthase